MTSRNVAPSLGRRLVVMALLAIVPLGAIGFWATRSAARSGRLLLRSQLETQLAQVQRDVAQRWERARADLLMVGESEPVRIALLNGDPGSDAVPGYVQRMFAQVTAFHSLSIRDRSGLVRWTLVDRGSPALQNVRAPGANTESPRIEVNVPLTDLLTGDTIGSIEASLRVAYLLPAAASLAPPSGPLPALLVSGRRAVVPQGADERLFADERVTWSGTRWLAVRQPSGVPGVELVLAGALDPFVAPFASSARRSTIALLAAMSVIVLVIVKLIRRMTRDVERELAQREALAAVGEFASELAHEVRNPLTAIRLDLQRVEESAAEPDTVRGITTRVLHQIDRLDRAVTGALRVARSGSIEPCRVDLHAVLESAWRGAEPELAQRGARTVIDFDPEDRLEIEGDAAALEQLFLNLLLNSAHAIDHGGEVRVKAARRDHAIEIAVTDNGRGMTTAQLKDIEQPYRSTRRDGTGLGLKIARRIVASHEGELIVKSTIGAGTTVQVRLGTKGSRLPTTRERTAEARGSS